MREEEEDEKWDGVVGGAVLLVAVAVADQVKRTFAMPRPMLGMNVVLHGPTRDTTPFPPPIALAAEKRMEATQKGEGKLIR